MRFTAKHVYRRKMKEILLLNMFASMKWFEKLHKGRYKIYVLQVNSGTGNIPSESSEISM